ncbi:Aldehyde/histidinol dehydrogenase [Chytridium lagenaria]|nr:Aldehyde/histidinol dehydrogenase [Chytridium lagenaria]
MANPDIALQVQLETFAPRLLENYIDNAHVASRAGDTSVLNDTSKHIPSLLTALSTKADVDQAVASALKAFEGWSNRTIKDRIQVILRFHALVVKHQDELADLIVLEHGKTKTEALADVAKGNETVEYAISLPQLTQGKLLEVSRGVTCSDRRLPLGVVTSIVPFNFPFMVPMWTMPIAIALGNTMVLKLPKKVMDLLREAGLPPGVVNLVNGGAETATALVDHPDIKAVTFVGTSHVADLLAKRGRSQNKRVLALGGAKNHLVAYPDCNVEMASQDIVNSFAGCSGQRCMAASVLLTVGPNPSCCDMGPVIDIASRTKILGYIDQAEREGAEILLDGRGWANAKEGWWVGPTVILHKKKGDILNVQNKEEAIQIENANPYGNAAAIYTSDGGVAEWFYKRFSAGMIGINIGVPVPREPFSFGGINNSRFGDSDITGEGAINFFTFVKKVTTKWAPPTEASWLT